MLPKQLLFLTTILLLTGCVERGFELTVNKTTHTVTAIKSVDIRSQKNNETQTDIEEMNEAVSKAQHKQPQKTQRSAKKITAHINNSHTRIQQKNDKFNTLKTTTKTKKVQNTKDIQIKKDEEKAKAIQIKHEREALEEKLANEKKSQQIAAQKEREKLLEKKEKAAKKAEIEHQKALEVLKEKAAKDKLEKQLAEAKLVRERRAKAAKAALEAKIAKDRALQLKKSQEAKAALEAKIAEQNKLTDSQKVAIQAAQTAALRKQEALVAAQAEKLRKQREVAARAVKEKQNTPIKTVARLNFQPSTQTYQKFGTSEIHGHVVYLTPSGQEVHLKNTKIYLVPKNTTTDYWYANYYLQNKDASSLANSTVHYINATHLNLEQNFAFYGLATGTYYVIIESSYPSNIAKNKKVYIAKKIKVDKYKKIMTVFSKRL